MRRLRAGAEFQQLSSIFGEAVILNEQNLRRTNPMLYGQIQEARKDPQAYLNKIQESRALVAQTRPLPQNIIENQIANQIQIESRIPPTPQSNLLPLLAIGGLVLILLAR